jgi:hypothetical protein
MHAQFDRQGTAARAAGPAVERPAPPAAAPAVLGA